MSVGIRPGGSGGVAETPRRRSIRRWSLGHVAVAVAAILAFVANLAFLRSRDDATAVVVAARPIQAGEVVERSDLTTTMIRADAGVLSTLLSSPEDTEGRVARRSLGEGELVGAADLLEGAGPDGMASMSIPIDPAHAAGGVIRVGDRVDVVDVDQDGVAGYVVRDVPVLAVPSPATGALSAAGREHLVLGLEDEAVLAVAEAIADGEVDVVVTTGVSGD